MILIDLRDQIPSGHTGRYPIRLDGLVRIAWHHTVSHISWNTAVNATEEKERAHLLMIDDMHEAWGLNGIGYHGAAFASGRAYQVGSYDRARAHVKGGQNKNSVGLVMIGNFTTMAPSEGHLAAGRELIKSVTRRVGRQLPLVPHQQVPGNADTACPGPLWPEWLPKLREEATMPLEAVEKAWILRVTGPNFVMDQAGNVYIVRQKGKRAFSGGHVDFSFSHDWDDVCPPELVGDGVLALIPNV